MGARLPNLAITDNKFLFNEHNTDIRSYCHQTLCDAQTLWQRSNYVTNKNTLNLNWKISVQPSYFKFTPNSVILQLVYTVHKLLYLIKHILKGEAQITVTITLYLLAKHMQCPKKTTQI